MESVRIRTGDQISFRLSHKPVSSKSSDFGVYVTAFWPSYNLGGVALEPLNCPIPLSG